MARTRASHAALRASHACRARLLARATPRRPTQPGQHILCRQHVCAPRCVCVCAMSGVFAHPCLPIGNEGVRTRACVCCHPMVSLRVRRHFRLAASAKMPPKRSGRGSGRGAAAMQAMRDARGAQLAVRAAAPPARQQRIVVPADVLTSLAEEPSLELPTALMPFVASAVALEVGTGTCAEDRRAESVAEGFFGHGRAFSRSPQDVLSTMLDLSRKALKAACRA